MGSLGQSVRNQVRSLIADANLRSELTLTPKTVSLGSRGGYEQNTEADGTERIVFCIPSNYVKNRTGLFKFGDLKEGEVRFLIRDDEVLDTNDEVTFDGNTYHVRLIREIFFNEVTIAIGVTLSRKLD